MSQAERGNGSEYSIKVTFDWNGWHIAEQKSAAPSGATLKRTWENGAFMSLVDSCSWNWTMLSQQLEANQLNEAGNSL